MGKTKIVVDADVLIHFSKAGHLYLLPKIFPEYDYVILSTVYQEVRTLHGEIDNICYFLKSMSVIPFAPSGEMMREYAKLLRTFGKGESACMSYCKFTQNVVGSSNLRDIKTYCDENHITYLTTLDFFYYAWVRKLMDEKTIADAIADINAKGSRLPSIDITQYIPNSNL